MRLLGLIFLVLTLGSCKKEPGEPAVPEPLPEKQYELIEMQTPYGAMFIWLYEGTPLHKANFLKLSKEGFYDSLLFHRVIPGFMIQGGDPLGNGTGGPGYTVDAEIRDSIRHKRGSLAAARLGDQQNPERKSSGSQFYIAVSTDGTAHLNGAYTVFGEVIQGIEFADSIVKQPRNMSTNKPLRDQHMQVKVIVKSARELREEFGFTL